MVFIILVLFVCSKYILIYIRRLAVLYQFISSICESNIGISSELYILAMKDDTIHSCMRIQNLIQS
jgi:hypothetical protein